MSVETYGSAQWLNAISCKHGHVRIISSSAGLVPQEGCRACADESWAEWFEQFELRYEADHGSRYPLHGYDERDLRAAFERSLINAMQNEEK